MANPVKGETPLVLADGREFTLVLDMEAMLSIEDETGKPLPQVMKMAQEGFMTAMAAIARAAFQRSHPDTTRADVLEILRTDQEALAEALGSAAEHAFPQDRKAGNVGKRQAGKSSGGSGASKG